MDAHERIARGLLDPVAALEEKDARIAALEAALEAVLDDIAGKDGGLGLLQRTVLEHAERTLRGEGE